MTGTDFDALLAALPHQSTAEVFAEIDAARKAAEQAPPPELTIIPAPVYPPLRWPHPDAGIIRFPCALGCGWAHAEDSYAESLESISIPVGVTVQELDRIFNERAKERGDVLRARIEGAIREHFQQAHPGQEPPTRRPW